MCRAILQRECSSGGADRITRKCYEVQAQQESKLTVTDQNFELLQRKGGAGL